MELMHAAQCISFFHTLGIDDKRRAFAAPREALVREVAQLSSCPKCGFMSSVLAVFLPPFSPAGDSVLQAGQLSALLAPQGIVNLLQFVWQADNPFVTLSNSLLEEPQLLESFLKASLKLLNAPTASCSRHGGLAGPAELEDTARRLRQQQQRLVQQLQETAAAPLQAEVAAEASHSVATSEQRHSAEQGSAWPSSPTSSAAWRPGVVTPAEQGSIRYGAHAAEAKASQHMHRNHHPAWRTHCCAASLTKLPAAVLDLLAVIRACNINARMLIVCAGSSSHVLRPAGTTCHSCDASLHSLEAYAA